jgi:DNA-binding response OmpR family regulator
VAPRTNAALQLAAQHAPDLAIVNLMLEVDVDGFHTATELARRHNVMILIATGFPDSVLEAQDLKDLACEVVQKPYTDDELLGAVARCFATAP